MSDRPILRLRFLHKRLDHEIAHEQRHRLPDPFRVARLKKLKLAIKDRIASHSAPKANPA